MSLSRLQKYIEYYWYHQPGPLWALLPLEYGYRVASKIDRRKQLARSRPLPVPVVVVGNLSVGGTGKTPALIDLLGFLCARGLKPGVVSRGYGREEAQPPLLVDANTTSKQAGEEPLLIFRETACPVSVHRDRQLAAQFLLEKYPECDVILADDGLQHYRLAHDIEIALVDGERLFGNRHTLPLGPLREPIARLASVDWIVVNQRHAATEIDKNFFVDLLGEHIEKRLSVARLQSGRLMQITDNGELTLEACASLYAGQKTVALAGIGNPEPFFNTLRNNFRGCECHAFADHYYWRLEELQAWSGRVLICTAKDAVKLRETLLAHPEVDASNWYYLQVELQLEEPMKQAIYSHISQLREAQT